MNLLHDESNPPYKPTTAELCVVLDSLLASRAMIYEDGVSAERKAESARRVALTLEHGEVERVLGDLGGTRWKNALN